MTEILFHSCRLPAWEDDSYLPYNQSHNASIYDWIPMGDDGKFDACNIYSTSNQTNYSMIDTTTCSDFVFDRDDLWGVSFNEEVSITNE